MSSPHRDFAVQTSPSMTGLRIMIDDAAAAADASHGAAPTSGGGRSSLHVRDASDSSTCDECKQRAEEESLYAESPSIHKSSAARRHFAKYEPQQLQQMNDEIELGWDCGICLETAEDPCVTRCGHLYCQSHLNHWLSTHPSCPVCKAICTPAQDVVPIFSRGRISPLASPISSTPPSPSPTSSYSNNNTFDSDSSTPTTTSGRLILPSWSGITEIDSLMSDYDIMSRDVPQTSTSTPPIPSPPQQIDPHPHPLMTSHLLAHYLGIALRIVGVGILLGVLLR